MTTQRYVQLSSAVRRKAPQDEVFGVCQNWAQSLFSGMGFKLEITGEHPLEEPCIYVGNHTSYLDIPLVWTASEAVFVSKKEVRYWPVIGAAAEALGTIWVDRSSMSSRAKVIDSMREGILTHKKRVCIFPEGTSSVEGTPWRWGAFKLAKQLGVPVQPFRIFYYPVRETAYMDNDTLTTQWWKCMNSPYKLASIEWGKPTQINDFQGDVQVMQKWVRDSFEKIRKESHEK